MKVFAYWHDLKEMPPYIGLCIKIMEKVFGKDFALYERESFIREFPDVREDIWTFEHHQGGINSHCSRSNYIRSHLLKKYGGFWIDADTIVVNNFFNKLAPLFEEYDYIARRQESGYVAMNFMGSRPGGMVINRLLEKQDEFLNENTFTDSGSKFAARMLTGIMNNVLVKDYYTVPERKISPINFKNSKNYFRSDLSLANYNLNEVFCFMLYNRAFPDWFRSMPVEELLEKDWFISRLMLYALEKAGV